MKVKKGRRKDGKTERQMQIRSASNRIRKGSNGEVEEGRTSKRKWGIGREMRG